MHPRIHDDSKQRGSAQHGFSLIELLAAIAVVAVLATISFQVFNHIRVSAERTTCASNMRQVWQGTLLYTNDHNGELPKDRGYGDIGPWKINEVRTHGLVGWVAYLLEDYVPDSTWHCPDPNVIAYSESPGESFGRVWRKREPTGWKSGDPYDRETAPYISQWENLHEKYVFICNPGYAGMKRPHNGKSNLLAMDGHIEIINHN